MLEINLLMADDEEELLENLSYDLKKVVKKIVFAKNGAEALMKLKENKIDIVITDINMPQKNGLVFAKEARAWGYNLPIIFLTAHGDDNLMKQALSLDAFDFIDKPYEKDTLIDILTEASKESLLQQESIKSQASEESEFHKSYLSMLKSKVDS